MGKLAPEWIRPCTSASAGSRSSTRSSSGSTSGSRPTLCCVRSIPDDLEPGKRSLALFLGQYWGGPSTYSEEKGHPRLRLRHAPFAIDEPARDAWLAAMVASVEESGAAEAEREMLVEYFVMAATAMINRPRETG